MERHCVPKMAGEDGEPWLQVEREREREREREKGGEKVRERE